jgi:DMSO/TMAO reductase YedYZ molybdopterin-dependent catalytic subunit
VVALVAAAVVASAASTAAGWPSPLEATADWLMEWTPVGLANVILQDLDPFARPAALLGALAIAMLAGGIAGALAALPGTAVRFRALGAGAGVIFLGLVFLWFFLPARLPPEIILIAAFPAALSLFERDGRSRRPRQAVLSARRAFLVRSGLVIGGAATLLALYSIRPLLRLPASRRLFAFRPPRGLTLAGLTDLVTPADRFYRMDKVLEPPEIGPPDWHLSIAGKVTSRLSLDYTALLDRERVDRYVTMECVDNPVGGSLISTALWRGISVERLLSEAGASGETIIFHGADRQTEGIPRRVLQRAGALVVYAMNGETLTREHGYPARLLLPGHYGFKSVKWLEHIDVADGPYRDVWEDHGWTPTAEIHTTTRIDVARRIGDTVLIAGVAFAGTRGIRAVQVRSNGGPWRRATLGPAPSRATWVQWTVRLGSSDPARIEARAVDGQGAVQTARHQGPDPDGATGWASVSV